MTTLFLVRHGENDLLARGILAGTSAGVHLNARGVQQAEQVAYRLKEKPITALYTSPLERAVETAAPLAHALQLKPILLPELRDSEVGDWTGRKVRSLSRLKAWQHLQADAATFQFPEGESIVEQQARLVKAFERILAAHGEKEMLAVVFHADPIKLVIAHFLGMPLNAFQRLNVDCGSISVLMVTGGTFQLASMNLLPPDRVP